MTVLSTLLPDISIGDGVTKVYKYNFKITATEDLDVLIDDVLQPFPTAYAIDGVGNTEGGNVTFGIAPPNGTQVLRTLGLTYSQETSYSLNGAFPSTSHEAALDRLALLLAQVREQLGRIPAFKQSISSIYRDLLLPEAIPLHLVGWDAPGTGLTLFPSTVLQVTPLLGGGAVVEMQAIQEVIAVNGQIQLTTTGFIPAGSRLTDGMFYLAEGWSTENGISAWKFGTEDDDDRYGRDLAITTGTVSNPGQEQNRPPEEPIPSGKEFVLTATAGGSFALTGRAIVTARYIIHVPPTAVP